MVAFSSVEACTRPFANVVEAIGFTPLVEIPRMSPRPDVHIYAKLEGHNPTGSVKDRIARSMIEDAERTGSLTTDKIILKSSSGNTGIALAMIGRRKGYRVTIVMPDNLTIERRQLLDLFGAEVIDSPGSAGSNGAVKVAQDLARDPKYYLINQYANLSNPRAHYETTAPEILSVLPQVDVFVAGLGTGGTLMGVGDRLREHNPHVRIIAAEPMPGEQVQGLRSLEDGYTPPIIDVNKLDGKILVRNRDAVAATRALAEREGIFAGVSSGAAVHTAARIADTMNNGNIVVLLADGGWKYLSAGLWTRDLPELVEAMEEKVWW